MSRKDLARTQHVNSSRPSLAPAEPSAAPIRGRGSVDNPAGRFERLHYIEDLDYRESQRLGAISLDGSQDDDIAETSGAETPSGSTGTSPALPRTQFLRDASRTVLTRNTSPDVHYDVGLNPYRGCEHGCVYCYARPTHEYLGLSPGLDFETRILVKERAAELLRKEMLSRRWKPQVVGMSGVTDPYQPVERVLGITRRCLAVFAEFRNPVGVITKNALVARDIDHFRELAAHDAASVFLSITTLDSKLHRVMEPRASHPRERLGAISKLAEAGVPVGVMIGPVIPGLSDHEMPSILQAARDAGAQYAGHIVLRLPGAVEGLFASWLARHYPDRRQKVLNRLRSLRDGALNDPRFGARMRGEGPYAVQIHRLFEIARERSGLEVERKALSASSFRRPSDGQLGLFES